MRGRYCERRLIVLHLGTKVVLSVVQCGISTVCPALFRGTRALDPLYLFGSGVGEVAEAPLS